MKTSHVRWIGAAILLTVFQIVVALFVLDTQPADSTYWDWWLHAQGKIATLFFGVIAGLLLMGMGALGLNLLITGGERDNSRGMY